MSFVKKYILPVLLSVIGIFIFLVYPKSSSGTIYHSRMRVGNITIHRDEYGIPHIHADSYMQAAFAMGFVMAQDRLWSIEVRRRLSQGRLSEIFGSRTFGIDKLVRTVGIPYHANKTVQAIDAYTLGLYEAFAAGINEYVQSRNFLPLEFWIVWSGFEPFTAFDSISIYKYAAFSTSNDWIAEQMRATLAEALGKEKAKNIIAASNLFEETLIINDDELKTLGRYSKQAKEILETNNFTSYKEAIHRLHKNNPTAFDWNYFFAGGGDLERFLTGELFSLEGFRGSNSWAIHGNLTESGRPLLAMDLHLPNTIPSVWYQVEIVLKEEFLVIGMALTGVPGIVSGKNAYVSWGATVLNADSSDLFEETLTENETKYLFEGKYYDIIEREELIRLQNGSVYPLIVKHTRHGPILENYSLREVLTTQFPNWNNKKYSLAWTGAKTNDTCLGIWFKLCTAVSAQQIIDIYQNSILTQNVVFATVTGDIGYIGSGKFIKRAHYQNSIFPKNGSNVEDEWIGMSQAKDLVKIINPAKGYIVAANNKVTSDYDRGFFGYGMQSNSRAYRIQELIHNKIRSNTSISAEDCKAWQYDVEDSYVKMILPDLIEFISRNKDKYPDTVSTSGIDQVLFEWAGWDSTFDSQKTAPLMFALWETRLKEKLLLNFGIGEEERRSIVHSHWFEQFFFASLKNWTASVNLDDEICRIPGDASRKQPCAYAIIKSCEEVIIEISRKENSPSALAWGSKHTIEYIHLPFSYSPIISFFFHRTVYGAGNQRTLNYAKYQPSRSKGFPSTFSTNFRMVIDMWGSSSSYFILETGVSENPFSRHYDDQMKLHDVGKYIPMIETHRNKSGLNITDTFRFIYQSKGNATIIPHGSRKRMNINKENPEL